MATSLSYGPVEIYYDDVLGTGAFGKVCKAKCGQLPCAAKLLHDTLFQDNDPGTHNLTNKFLQECQFISTIKHPSIVQYLGTDSDPQSKKLVLLMELMDGNLTRFLEQLTGPLPYHSQLSICHDVALALAYLHSNDIIHRDLSSNNVLLIGEGSRAKVTDFGMSKLMDMNPRMTVPGIPAYMPPEALITPPHYSSQLDCFSHGVLTLQIITKNFPNPGNATTIMEDSRFPTGRAFVPVPERERRKKDIDLVEPSHPLLPTILDCLKDRDTERPSADDLCGRLASLKSEPRYTDSVHQTREHTCILERERTEHLREIETLRRERNKHDRELEEELQKEREKNHRLQDEVEKLKTDLLRSGGETISQAANDMDHVDKESEGGQLLANPVKLRWRQGEPAPEKMRLIYGTAMAHGRIDFSYIKKVYSYTASNNKWTKLPECKYEDFALAVVKDKLTSIGGINGSVTTNSLFSLCGSSWVEVHPAMPTKRCKPAAASTHTHLVVAGGMKGHRSEYLSTVEVLTQETLQWSTASSLPVATGLPQLTLCGGSFYFLHNHDFYSCSVEDLLESCKPATNSNDGVSVWTELAAVPVEYGSSLVTLRGCVLAIGGSQDEYGNNPTEAIHCYNVTTSSWSVIGEMPTPRSHTLAAVLSSNDLVVVGGRFSLIECCQSTDIGNFS